jgi:flagellar biosynthesis/type III secretory pathway protein FliH
MRRAGATWNQWRVAGLVAMARGRYKEMVKAMQKTKVEPAVVIEFVEYGRDRYQRGLRRGIKQGLQQGVEQARGVLLATLAARGVRLGRAERKRIADESALELLLRWVQRAATAGSAAEVFET